PEQPGDAQPLGVGGHGAVQPAGGAGGGGAGRAPGAVDRAARAVGLVAGGSSRHGPGAAGPGRQGVRSGKGVLAQALRSMRVKWISSLSRSTPSTFQPAEIHARACECDSVLAHQARWSRADLGSSAPMTVLISSKLISYSLRSLPRTGRCWCSGALRLWAESVGAAPPAWRRQPRGAGASSVRAPPVIQAPTRR